MRPGRVNITLLLLMVLFGSLIYFSEKERIEDVGQRLSGAPFLDIAPHEVDFLRLEYRDQIIELKKESDHWSIVLPFRDRASDALVDGVLKNWRLISTSPLEGMNAVEDRVSLGLNPAEKRIVVGSKTARRSIHVGKSLPLAEGVYMQRSETEMIQLSSENPFASIPESLNDFRQRNLFSGVLEDVKRFEIRGGEQSIQCVRDDSGAWMILQPVSGRGDAGFIQGFLEALYEIRVSRFVADQVSDPGIYAIDERSPEIRLYFKGEAEADIVQIGSQAKASGEVYASDPSRSSVYTVSNSVAGLLEADVKSFRDHRPVPYLARDIHRVDIRLADKTTQLEQQEGGGWIVKNPEPRPASEDRVTAFLDLWTSPVISGFMDVDTVPPESEERIVAGSLEFTVKGASGDTDQTWPIQFYPSLQPGELQIYLAHDNAWGRVPAALLEERAAQPYAFYSLNILALDKTSMVGFEIESVSFTQKVFKTEGEGYQSEVGVINAEHIERLSDTLVSLEALAAVAESLDVRPHDYFSANTDILTVHVSGDVGISRKLLLGKRTPSGSRYLKVLGDPVVYLIPSETASLLIQNLVLPPDSLND